jgi:hypothetical protein
LRHAADERLIRPELRRDGGHPPHSCSLCSFAGSVSAVPTSTSE